MSEIGKVQGDRIINGYNGVIPIVFPIAGDSYKIRDNWHVKRSKNRCSFDHSFNEERRAHNGVDIGCKLGTPVYACVNGIVIESPMKDFPSERYGNSVWIQSTQEDITCNYRFLFAHLDEVHVAVGTQVDTFTQIGTLGMTGNAIRPHLHFEIHYPLGNNFYCHKCAPEHCNVAAINPFPSLNNSIKRIKNEVDFAAEKRNVTLRTVGNTITKLFDKVRSFNI